MLAIGRDRDENIDLEIIRTMTVALPYRFSANISQITEYGNARPRLFSELIKLINAKVIDATSTSATPDEFIADRQARYAHVPDRYPFYFKNSGILEGVGLGSRNSFSMTDDLSRIISGYSSDQFDFELVRANPGDKVHFESSHRATVTKILNRDDLAITRDLLESNRGGTTLTPQGIAATTRAISAIYMKNYAEQRGLATCTGIPDFNYREIDLYFPRYDFPLIHRVVQSLGGAPLIFTANTEEILALYGTPEHEHFGYYLGAFLESVAATVRPRANQPDNLASLRTLFHQVFIRELDGNTEAQPQTVKEFYIIGQRRLLAAGERIASKDSVFENKWRDFVPTKMTGLVAITTATDSEDAALFECLESHGFSPNRMLRVGDGVLQEFARGVTQRIVHIRTSAGSMGVNSAGMVLPNVLQELDVKYLVSAGICFGLKPFKDGKEFQKLGDVLIATHIQDYETKRKGEQEIPRGERTSASPGILQATRIARTQTTGIEYQISEGILLSGQMLVDDEQTVEELRAAFPEAIGGEMEGNAVAGASIYKGRQWILIKGICDWGMGKEDGSQAIAAERACSLAVKAIVNLLDAESP
jgi:nucleoside phosphorylase